MIVLEDIRMAAPSPVSHSIEEFWANFECEDEENLASNNLEVSALLLSPQPQQRDNNEGIF